MDSESIIQGELTGQPFGRIQLTNGAHNNTFSRVRLHNSDVAVQIGAGAGNYPNGQPIMNGFDYETARSNGTAAYSNRFENCVFVCETAIQLSNYSDDTLGNYSSPCWVVSNSFVNCNFIADPNYAEGDKRGFFSWYRNCFGNNLTNCIIYGFPKQMNEENTAFTYGGTTYFTTPYGNAPVAGWTYDSCCFYNISNGSEVFPSYSSCVYSDPLMDDEALPTTSSVFELDENSPCVNAGDGTNAVTDNFTGAFRNAGQIDIGANEYNFN